MEAEFIKWLKQRLPAHPRLLLGPGDDAAVVDFARNPRCVVTVDLVSDGVDFELAQIDPRQAGYKALAVNLSDMAAMAARPVAAVIALLLPRAGALDLACRLYEGLLPLAEKFDLAIAGGDTNTWDHPLAVSVTLLGEPHPRGVVRRDGARPGDRLLVTGELGGSILGKHLCFEPRVAEAQTLHQRYSLHALMDISDGLALDLARMCAESGCGAVLDLARVPVSAAARERCANLGDGATPLQCALSDGEDFELLLALPPDEAKRALRDQPLPIPLTEIGECVPQTGLWQLAAEGALVPLPVKGYLH